MGSVDLQTLRDIQKTNWPQGVPQHLTVPNESLWEAFSQLAQTSPKEIGLNYLGQNYTWAELVEAASRLASAMQDMGVGKGDRVILFAQNCPQWVISFHAVIRLGAVVVPVNPMNKAVELTHYIEDAHAALAIASSDIAAELLKANASAQVLTDVIVFELADALPKDATVIDALPDLWQRWLMNRHGFPEADGVHVHAWTDAMAHDVLPISTAVHGADLALLPYTSGTTGLPKGCMHTHASLMHNAIGAGPWLDLRAGDKQMIVVPLFHITGLVMGMLACIQNGAQIVLLPRWDRKVAGRTITQQQVTHWPNIPTMVIDLLSGDDLDQYKLSSLRYIGGGGAPMPDAVGERLKAVYDLDYVEGYGLTESSAPTHLNPMSAPHRHCLGIPYIGTQAFIMDAETLQPLPVGEVGEIVAMGPQLFKGYWKQAEATQQAFVTIEGQSYFRTGDMGRMDADGYFYMADRLKRMINASGFKVWPAEVEALLHHHDAIKESCVISTKDPYRGENVKALIVLHEKFKGQVTTEEIIEWAKNNMAAYKYPREVVFVDELPRTATGKVLWRKAQAMQDLEDSQKSR